MGLIVIADLVLNMAANSFYNQTRQEFERLMILFIVLLNIENVNHLRILMKV
jgi:hypothetical protein